MFNSKLTKIAALVALTAAGAANAKLEVAPHTAAANPVGGTAEPGVLSPIEGSNHKIAYQNLADDDYTSSVEEYTLTYTAPVGAAVGMYVKFDFTNVKVLPYGKQAGAVVATTETAGLTLTDGTNSWSPFEYTVDSDNLVSSVTYLISGSNVTQGTKLSLVTDDDTAATFNFDNTAGDDANETRFVFPEDLANGSEASVKASVILSDAQTVRSGSEVTMVMAELIDGVAFKASGVTTTNELVSFATGGEEFIDGSGTKVTSVTDINGFFELTASAARSTVADSEAGQIEGLVSGDISALEFTLTAPDCAEVKSVALNNGTVNSSKTDADNCTWVWDDTDNNADNLTITVEGDEDIVSKDWTLNATATVNTVVESTDAITTHSWSGDVQGDSITVPYMQYIDSSNWSQVTFNNASDKDVNIAAEVTLVEAVKENGVQGAYNGVKSNHKNYFVGTIPATGMLQLSGVEIVEALNAASGDPLEGYNNVSAEVDTDKNYHMTVKFTFDGQKSIDLVSGVSGNSAGSESISAGDISVSAFNVAGAARYALPTIAADEQ